MFGDSGFIALKKALEVCALRQKVISNNIANLTTPYFQPSRVEFEEILRQRMRECKLRGKRTHARHLPLGRVRLKDIIDIAPRIRVNNAPIPEGKINNVVLEKEMTEMAQNAIKHEGSTKLLAYKYKLLLSAIGGK